MASKSAGRCSRPLADEGLEERRVPAVPLPEMAVAPVGLPRAGGTAAMQPVALPGAERVRGKLGMPLRGNVGLEPVPMVDVQAKRLVGMTNAPQPVLELRNGDDLRPQG